MMDVSDPPPYDFEEWYLATWTPLVRALLAYCGDRELAVDAAAEACAKALSRWDEVRSMRSPNGWAFSVGRTYVVRSRRRALRLYRPALHARHPEVENPADMVVDHQELLRLLDKLPPRQREAVVLCYILDLSQEDAARTMGITRGGLAATLNKAGAGLKSQHTQLAKARVEHGK